MGVEEGLRSLTASAIVMVCGDAWTSSRDGAVMRMTGGRGQESTDSEDSMMDCVVGGFSVTERKKVTHEYQGWKTQTGCHLIFNKIPIKVRYIGQILVH